MRMKKLAITALAIPVLAAATFFVAPSQATGAAADTATDYRKCSGCHGKDAKKHFDAKKSDAELVKVILNGKGTMPAYASKGISEAQAKALVAHMRQLSK